MDNERLIAKTWLEDMSDQSIVAYADAMADDLLITVTELDVLGDNIAITLFNVKLLDASFQQKVWERLMQFDPFIQKQAEQAGVDLRGVLIRIMDVAWTWAHISSECLELRLSLLEGWRGIRLLSKTSDVLLAMVKGNREPCGESLDGSPMLS